MELQIETIAELGKRSPVLAHWLEKVLQLSRSENCKNQ
jgi:hypothetical protein